MDAVVTWLLEKWPTIGVIIVVAIIMWFVGRYFLKLEEARKTVDKLPCKDYKQSIDGLQSVKNTVDSINDQVTEISKWVMHLDGNMIDALSKKCSPRVMTALGRNLFDISGANKVLDDNVDFLLEELNQKGPQTAYDVENNALDVLLGNLSHPMFNPIKEYIYYQPEEITLKNEVGEDRQIKLTLMAIVQLMGLELRDRYLALHPTLGK